MMRRRGSLLVIVALVLLAVYAYGRYAALRPRAPRGVITVHSSQDTLAQQDSAARADAREAVDTMCIAGRFGLPCDPR
jgi:hypothetical protein